jgi:hypothetical protein
MGNWGFVLWLIGLSAMTFFAVAWLLDISSRQRQLQERIDQSGVTTEGQDFSGPLSALTQRLDNSEQQTQQLRTELERLQGQVGGIQAVGLVRFQAFNDYGGDQSFALALASAAGDGVVLSGIYAREGTRVYAKPLTTWSSSYSLSFEEEEAIGQAQSQVQ